MNGSQRRKFFSSFTKPFNAREAVTLRPPYCADFSLFDSECLTCKEKPCATLCQEEIVFIDEQGRPALSFEKSGCTYCDACAKACDKEVLSFTCKSYIRAKTSIDVRDCLAWNGTICSSCSDVCDEKAIEFFGLLKPVVKSDKCTNCGFCYSICPTKAVVIKGV